MILNQEIMVSDDKKKFTLRNTFDCSAAIAAAKEATENGGRTNNTIVPLGFIPPEMWMYNPWLLEAKKALRHGDKRAYQENILKFFKLFPMFAVLQSKRFY